MKMDLSIKDTAKMIRSMVLASKFGRMVLRMKENGGMGKHMVEVSY